MSWSIRSRDLRRNSRVTRNCTTYSILVTSNMHARCTRGNFTLLASKHVTSRCKISLLLQHVCFLLFLWSKISLVLWSYTVAVFWASLQLLNFAIRLCIDWRLIQMYSSCSRLRISNTKNAFEWRVMILVRASILNLTIVKKFLHGYVSQHLHESRARTSLRIFQRFEG